MAGSPYGLRDSLMTLEKLEKPDLRTMNIIREDVEKTYADSSDDEHYQDKIFQNASHELTQ